MIKLKPLLGIAFMASLTSAALAQDASVMFKNVGKQKKVDVWIGGKLFTTFMYPDSLEKPVLYPITTAKGTTVMRGFPLNPKPGDPTDHPNHIGLRLILRI